MTYLSSPLQKINDVNECILTYVVIIPQALSFLVLSHFPGYLLSVPDDVPVLHLFSPLPISHHYKSVHMYSHSN